MLAKSVVDLLPLLDELFFKLFLAGFYVGNILCRAAYAVDARGSFFGDFSVGFGAVFAPRFVPVFGRYAVCFVEDEKTSKRLVLMCFMNDKQYYLYDL